jgi:hypothetical protein
MMMSLVDIRTASAASCRMLWHTSSMLQRGLHVPGACYCSKSSPTDVVLPGEGCERGLCSVLNVHDSPAITMPSSATLFNQRTHSQGQRAAGTCHQIQTPTHQSTTFMELTEPCDIELIIVTAVQLRPQRAESVVMRQFSTTQP